MSERKRTEGNTNPKLEVMVFTDPYCSWCWATEPMILSMAEKYRDQIHFTYVFGGLIKDMDNFYDSSNDIADASAVLPHWKMVSERSGQPINEMLWDDLSKIRHFSSWPANIACKAAFFQGENVGERYLRNMRMAALTDRKIISNEEVYNEIAKNTEGLDFEQFKRDLDEGNAKKAFEEDQIMCIRWEAHGFPTMLFYKADADFEHLTKETATYVGGHRSMETYDDIIRDLVPDINVFASRDEKELLAEYGPMTEREIGEIKKRSKEEEYAILENLANNREILKFPKVRGNIWSLK